MNRLQKLRELHGWNKKEAAEEIGIPYTTYIGYESESRGMDSETLLRLASFYGVTVDYLLCNDEYATPLDLELVEKLQILRDREDLRGLLDVTSNNTPEQVEKLIALFGTMQER